MADSATDQHPPIPHHHSVHDFSPIEFTEFFDQKVIVDIDGDKFNVYLKGTAGPVFYLLHGGGYTGLTWACLAEELSSRVDCRIVAPDLRGHGLTHTRDDADLSTETQVKDIEGIYNHLYDTERPNVIMIGHSMGGALAVHVVNNNKVPNVQALAVIDVVEGTAMSALVSMKQVLRSRPSQFKSVDQAVRWCFESHTTRNLRAAKVSMPSQIVEVEENNTMMYKWRINLSKTNDHWNGWFSGLSQLFLKCKPVKILILANVDRLDKELTIGQMRGLFQYEVLSDVGHALHEDSPAKVSDIFANLIRRYQFIFGKNSKVTT